MTALFHFYNKFVIKNRYWNTINTKAQEDQGGCFTTCIAYVSSPDIEPEEDPRWGSPCNPSECNTQINDVPTCTPDMYVNGSDTRLNACLQCDECRSGPLFQRIAARTRRGSGIRYICTPAFCSLMFFVLVFGTFLRYSNPHAAFFIITEVALIVTNLRFAPIAITDTGRATTIHAKYTAGLLVSNCNLDV
jgi:hypothetical protein